MTFAAAFGLEALLLSNELSVRILICPVLLTVTLLISWRVGAAFETKTNFSTPGKSCAFRDRPAKFTRVLRGKTKEPRAYEGDAGDDGGQGMNGIPERTRSLKGAFGRRWRGRARALTNATLANPPDSNSPCGPPNGAGVQTDERNKEAATSI